MFSFLSFGDPDLTGSGFVGRHRPASSLVEERQALEKLTREEKTASRTFTQLRDRQEELEQKRTNLREESDVFEAKRCDVRILSVHIKPAS